MHLTYQLTSDPLHALPGRIEKDSISAALASAYDLRMGKGYHAGTEIRQDGTPIYDKKALADAVYRIYAFVHLDNMTLDEAADRVAREDGY